MPSKRNKRLGDFFHSRRERGGQGLPTLSVTLDRGLVPRDTLERKTDSDLSPQEHLRVHRGDIVYNMMRMWQGASGLADEDAIVSPAYIVLAPKPNMDPLFAAYLFKSARMIHLFWAYSYGLTKDRLRLYFKDFSLIPASIPSIEEQRRIAKILATWDRAIETTEKLIENSEAQKKALMQQLLTGKQQFSRLKGEWRRGVFGDGIQLISGQHIESKAVNTKGSGYPYLTGPADFSNGYITVSKYTETPKVCCKSNDILLTVKGSGTGKSIIADEDYCISRQLMAIRPEKFDRHFTFHVLQEKIRQFGATASGLIPGISRNDVLNSPVFIPPKETQEQIGRSLSSFDLIAENQRRHLKSLRQQKRALMQQLLAGKQRVKVESNND